MANCLDYTSSEQEQHFNYVKDEGMLGFMFWAAENPSARKNYRAAYDCEPGMGVSADEFDIVLP